MYELPPAPRRLPPLVQATTELRTLVAVLGALGLLLVAGAVAIGHLARLTPLEVADIIIVFGVSTGTSAAAVALGRWTGPRMLYRNILDRAPGPPPQARSEPRRRTRARTIAASAATAAAFVGVAAVASAIALAVMGKARADIPDHLPAIAAAIGGGWALACAAAASVVARWLERWERTRGRVVLCAPLHSARLSPVYFTRPDDA